jgi:hypothetical protein
LLAAVAVVILLLTVYRVEAVEDYLEDLGAETSSFPVSVFSGVYVISVGAGGVGP